MAKPDEIKKLIANTLKINAADINDDFLLKSGKMKTSAGSVILSNIVKKIYGVKMSCENVSTFGELIRMAQGGNIDESEPVPLAADIEEYPERTDSPITGQYFVCGIDIQEVDVFPEVDDYWKESFYTDSFTKNEIAYCVTAASPRHSFAARWCLKEALHKCGAKYYGIPLSNIQVVKQRSGAVILEMLEDNSWKALPFSCSLSHAEKYAVGMVTGFER